MFIPVNLTNLSQAKLNTVYIFILSGNLKRCSVCPADVEIKRLRYHHVILALMPEFSVTPKIPRGALKRP